MQIFVNEQEVIIMFIHALNLLDLCDFFNKLELIKKLFLNLCFFSKLEEGLKVKNSESAWG